MIIFTDNLQTVQHESVGRFISIFDEFDVNSSFIEGKQFSEKFKPLFLQFFRLFIVEQPNCRVKHLVKISFLNVNVYQHFTEVGQKLMQQFEFLSLPEKQN